MQKKKIDILFPKSYNLYLVKYVIKKVKKQMIKWDKTYNMYILICKMYNISEKANFHNLQWTHTECQEDDQPDRNWPEDMNRQFTRNKSQTTANTCFHL